MPKPNCIQYWVRYYIGHVADAWILVKDVEIDPIDFTSINYFREKFEGKLVFINQFFWELVAIFAEEAFEQSLLKSAKTILQC